METSIIKIGNSRGVIIPAEWLKSMGLTERSTVLLEQSGEMLVMRARPQAQVMTGMRFYVCPVCGNLLYATGDTELCCHGHHLAPLTAQDARTRFTVNVETVEDELFVSVEHPMTKQDHIAYMAALSADRVQMVRLYPEGPAEARFKKSLVRTLVFYSTTEGLFTCKPFILTKAKDEG